MTHSPVSAAQWLERIRALPLSRPVKILNVCGGHERSISAAGLRAALPVADRAHSRSRVPGVHLSRGGYLRGDPARAARGRDAGRVRRHAARAGQRAEERAALARAGEGGRRGRASDREPARCGAHRAGEPGAARRVPRGRIRNDDRAVRGACWPKVRRTICLSCSPGGAPGPPSRNCSRAAPPPSMRWSRRGTSRP